MTHLRWKIESSTTYKADANGTSSSSGTPRTIEAVAYADVWIEPDQITYRVPIFSIHEGRLETNWQEFLVSRQHYAIMQDYDCRLPGTKEWKVCNIRVVPTYGPSLTWTVPMLEFNTNHLWPRTLLTGRLIKEMNGVPFHYGGKVVYDDYTKKPDLPRPAGWGNQMHATYKDGKVSSLTWFNPVDGRRTAQFRDLKWQGGKIVGFTGTDLSIQAQRLTLPRSTQHFTLVAQDEAPCDVVFRKGTNVFDYRLCGPTGVLSFPDPSCPPKTYAYGGNLLDIKQLKDADSGALPALEPPENLASIPLLASALVAALACSLLAFRVWKKPMKE